jgi:thioredoxin 1
MGETNGKPITVTDADFETEIQQHQGLAMVDFWAAWCGPCRMIAPMVEQISRDYEGRVKVAKLDVDANPEVSMRFQIRSIPTILFFKDGEHVDTVVGAVPKPHIERAIEKHLG